jgi:hypothetical protein
MDKFKAATRMIVIILKSRRNIFYIRRKSRCQKKIKAALEAPPLDLYGFIWCRH